MQYEFKLKVKLDVSHNWEEKYECIVEEKGFEYIKKRYDEYIDLQKKLNSRYDYILLINLLDDDGEFVRAIQ